MIITGIFLEVLAAALGTTSKQLIAFAEHSQKPWISHLGAGINIAVGPLVDASAYAFAPAVVVAPFACLDVIFNALTAPYTLHWQKEELSRVHVAATALVATGAVFTAVFGSVHDDVLTVYQLEALLTKSASLVYLFTECVAILWINLCLQAKIMSSTVRGICLGGIAGVLMGNVFFVKGFIVIVRNTLTTGDFRAWLRPTPYLCLACAACGSFIGFQYMRKGLAEYKGIFMVTIFEGAHITAACLSGCIVMEEMAHAPWWQYVFYWLSVLLIVSGIVLINTAAMDSELTRRSLIGSGFEKTNALVDADHARPLLHHYKCKGDLAGLQTCKITHGRTARNVEIGTSYLALDNVDRYRVECIEAGVKDPVIPEKKDTQF